MKTLKQTTTATFVAPTLEDCIKLAPVITQIRLALEQNRLAEEFDNMCNNNWEEKAKYKNAPYVQSYISLSAENIKELYDFLLEVGLVDITSTGDLPTRTWELKEEYTDENKED